MEGACDRYVICSAFVVVAVGGGGGAGGGDGGGGAAAAVAPVDAVGCPRGSLIWDAVQMVSTCGRPCVQFWPRPPL